MLCYSIVILIHYVFGFTLLLVVYWMVLVRIKKMKKVYSEEGGREGGREGSK